MFCSVFSRPWSEGSSHHERTFSIYLRSLSLRLALIPRGVLSMYWLMLSIQGVRDLPRLRAPRIVPCIVSFSRQLPCYLMVWPYYASFLALTVSDSSLFTPALLRTHSFVFFAVHETRRIFLNHIIWKASRRVSSFFLSVHLSQPYVATGHTSAFSSRIFVEISMLWLFHTFCSDGPMACPCLTWYGTEFRRMLSVFCNQGPKVRERIHLLKQWEYRWHREPKGRIHLHGTDNYNRKIGDS